jgi:hypothetical protein
MQEVESLGSQACSDLAEEFASEYDTFDATAAIADVGTLLAFAKNPWNLILLIIVAIAVVFCCCCRHKFDNVICSKPGVEARLKKKRTAKQFQGVLSFAMLCIVVVSSILDVCGNRSAARLGFRHNYLAGIASIVSLISVVISLENHSLEYMFPTNGSPISLANSIDIRFSTFRFNPLGRLGCIRWKTSSIRFSNGKLFPFEYSCNEFESPYSEYCTWKSYFSFRDLELQIVFLLCLVSPVIVISLAISRKLLPGGSEPPTFDFVSAATSLALFILAFEYLLVEAVTTPGAWVVRSALFLSMAVILVLWHLLSLARAEMFLEVRERCVAFSCSYSSGRIADQHQNDRRRFCFLDRTFGEAARLVLGLILLCPIRFATG